MYPTTTLAQSGSVDDTIQKLFGPAVDLLETIVFYPIPLGGAQMPIVVLWLLAAGIFLTGYLRVRPIGDAVQTARVVRGQLTRRSDPGEVTSFQALATELSGTIGLGNIAGVAVAISIGGPGAALWIMIAGVLGMAVKLAEATLSQMFRRIDDNGKVSGGPMYYLKDGLASIGRPKLGSSLAFIYAFCFMFAALGAGNIFQSNQLAAHIVDSTGGDASFFAGRTWIIGLVLAVITGLVVIGGIKSIAKWTSRLVPAMSTLYALCVFAVLAANFEALPSAFSLIFTGAFNPEGVSGGVVGVAIIGIQRALFSNVAGVGTAGLAHSVSKNRRPTEEGLVAAWEPFLDSVVVCTMTALAIIVSGQYLNTEASGVVLTTNAFSTVHSLFPILLSVCIILFAFSTILSYSYYGQKAAGYLFKGSRKAEMAYNVLYLIMVVIGAAVSLDTVVRFSDAMFFLVAIPNLLGIYLLAGPLKREVEGYRAAARDGQIKIVDKHERAPLFGEPTAAPVNADPRP